MAELPIVLVAYFFGIVSLAWTYAWIVVPLMIGAWLLLFVPSSTWAKARAALTAPFRRERAARVPSHRAVLNFR